MNKLFRFDSKCEKYKTPFGAIAGGESIMLSAYALRSEILEVNLVVFSEYEQSESKYPMLWESRELDYDKYSVSLSVSCKSGIFWYFFEFRDVCGNIGYWGKYGETRDKNCVAAYQLTVYSKDYKTPDWFSRGVTYHIFVDRFMRSTTSNPITRDDYFYVHENISDTPMYKPNNGVVENRDIYGGNLDGICEKLPYLEELGVKTIYLSPVFEAWSNHKYNTADYTKIDAHFGNEKTLKKLCKKAKERGMKVILDGVFSHTGSDSIYFNREGRYGEEVGAYRDEKSPYRSWFDIKPDGSYPSWWGIDTLPQVDELNEDYRDYIIRGKNSVISRWMKAGISGWRLDVADELPDVFIEELKKRSREEYPESLVIGEVWEDASTKKAYSVSKKYFTDGVLDGVMNYPLKNAILDFLCYRISEKDFKNILLALCENYPLQSKRCLMNIIGTHDTVRVLNELSVGGMHHTSKEERAERWLSASEKSLGKTRLFQAAVLQYMFPGSPCIYYGDEIGMEGFEDPFNRRFFTWDNIDREILDFYKGLGKIKCEEFALHECDFDVIYAKNNVVCVSMGNVIAFVNRGEKAKIFALPNEARCMLQNGGVKISFGKLFLAPFSCCIIKKDNE